MSLWHSCPQRSANTSTLYDLIPVSTIKEKGSKEGEHLKNIRYTNILEKQSLRWLFWWASPWPECLGEGCALPYASADDSTFTLRGQTGHRPVHVDSNPPTKHTQLVWMCTHTHCVYLRAIRFQINKHRHRSFWMKFALDRVRWGTRAPHRPESH